MSSFLRLFTLLCLLLAPVPALAQEQSPPSVRTLLAAPFGAIDEAEVKAFYETRDFKPAWGTENQPDPAPFLTFLDSIKAVIAYHGLNPMDYDLEGTKALIESSAPGDRAKLDIVLTDRILALAHDLHGDYLDLSQLYPGWDFERDPVDVVAVLSQAVENQDLASTIASFAPKAQAYTNLANGLKAYRELAAKGPWPRVQAGETLRPGMQDPRIQQLRARLAAEDYVSAESETPALFDEALKQALIAFQLRNGLQADGNLGVKTISALNLSIDDRIHQILANMERWRHMLDVFPENSVIVNIPDMTVTIFQDGKAIYHGPVVVGRVDRKTPFIQSAIRSVIFNPSWHVPTTIARKDILPKLRKDPHYLEKMGLVINGSASDPHGEEIDWHTIKASEFNFRLRQTPGDGNSLGRLKFDFDNPFSVYMHGTPHQETFAKAERAQSSGCVRLRDPQKVAEVVLSHNEGDWTPQKITSEIDANKTRWIGLKKNLPILFVYWTVFRDETSGTLAFRRDLYDYDRFLLQAMRQEETTDKRLKKN